MPVARVRLGFRNATDEQIVAMAEAVLGGMTDNASFPRPPVELGALRAALDEFKDAITAQRQGGTIATVVKYQKRRDVMQLVRKMAHYVEENCDDDLAVLLSSGFPAKSMSRARSACPKAVILR